MSSFTYFEEWATPKKWAYEWAYISPQPTHLSASQILSFVEGCESLRSLLGNEGLRVKEDELHISARAQFAERPVECAREDFEGPSIVRRKAGRDQHLRFRSNPLIFSS